MAKESGLIIVPDLSSSTGFKVVKVEPKRTAHLKSPDEVYAEVWGSKPNEPLSVIETLQVFNGILQDTNRAVAGAKKT